jgi:D-alanyl-D-alanine carboxypeptidase
MLFDGKRGKIIQSKKATIRREVASLTKMMTLYTAF